MNIILRSSWQTVNIGDIAHTPSLLALLEKYLPEATVTVWASDSITDEVIAMEHRRFPNIEFIKGSAENNSQIYDTIKKADFFLHGSGPFLVGDRALREFLKYSNNKPYGVFGITYKYQEDQVELLNNAEFLYFRDSLSLDKAKKDGIKAKIMEFGPDAAFATDLKNEERAVEFLKENDLEENEFVCCIPRLRYTPYWEIKDLPYDKEKDEYNNSKKITDHIHLLKAIEEVATKTNKKVLICPEDMTQMKIGKEELYDKLPKDILDRVVLRKTYWMTDEAVSVYRKAICLFGNEMHSPIMCVGNGIPAIVCRWEEQTTKGYMWNDIGLEDWLFDTDKGIDPQKFADTVLDIIKNPEKAKAKTLKARDYVETLYKRMVLSIKDAV